MRKLIAVASLFVLVGCGGATDRIEYVYADGGASSDPITAPCPDAGASVVADAAPEAAPDGGPTEIDAGPELDTIVAAAVVDAHTQGAWGKTCPASAPHVQTGDCYVAAGGDLAHFETTTTIGPPDGVSCVYVNDSDASVTIGVRIYCQR